MRKSKPPKITNIHFQNFMSGAFQKGMCLVQLCLFFFLLIHPSPA